MQKFYFLLMVLFTLVLITGCEQKRTDDEAGNTDTMQNTTDQNNTTTASTQYKITLTDNDFSPDTLRLTSGICYQIDFENTGNSEVEFVAGKNPSGRGFDDNFFKDIDVENIINNKELVAKEGESVSGIKLKPGEKGSLAFTADDNKKGEWLTAIRTGSKMNEETGILIIN